MILQKQKYTIYKINTIDTYVTYINCNFAVLLGSNQLKTVARIKLIVSKIKNKCKINLLRCRARNRIDAPSVRASKICSLELRAVQPRSWATGQSANTRVSTQISVLLQDYCRGGGRWRLRLKAGETFCLFEYKISFYVYIFLEQFVHTPVMLCYFCFSMQHFVFIWSIIAK